MNREPVWPSGKALLRLVNRRTSVRYRFGSPFSSKRLWFVDTDLWFWPSLPTEIFKWLSSLPILMQESFWWWQCSDRYISLSPHIHYIPPFVWWLERVVRRHVDHIQRRHTDQPKEAERQLPPPVPEVTHLMIYMEPLSAIWMIKLIQSCPQSEWPKRHYYMQQDPAVVTANQSQFSPSPTESSQPVHQWGGGSHSKIENLQNTWKNMTLLSFRLFDKVFKSVAVLCGFV